MRKADEILPVQSPSNLLNAVQFNELRSLAVLAQVNSARGGVIVVGVLVRTSGEGLESIVCPNLRRPSALLIVVDVIRKRFQVPQIPSPSLAQLRLDVSCTLHNLRSLLHRFAHGQRTPHVARRKVVECGHYEEKSRQD